MSKRTKIYLDFDSDDESDIEMEERRRAKKKSQGKKRKAVQAAGPQTVAKKLRGDNGLYLGQMPIDIMYEIFSQAGPGELLNLSRTTKALRDMLMNRSSISAWKQSFANVGLPACPFDLDEPEYANLVFGKSCFGCRRNLPVQHTVWTARLRLCTRCVEAKFREDITSAQLFQPLAEYIPEIDIVRGNKIKTYYCVDMSIEWRDEYTELPPEDQDNWLYATRDDREIIEDHAEGCRKWAAKQQRAREAEKSSLINERKNVLMDRLKQRGWAEELSMVHAGRHPKELPLVDKVCQKDLTDASMSIASVDSELDTYMEKIKADRLVKERKALFKEHLKTLATAYNDYLATQPLGVNYPNIAEIMLDPLVKDLIAKATDPAELEEQLVAFSPSFPSVIDNWRESVKRQLLGLVEQAYSTPPYSRHYDPEVVLHLVTTTFGCKSCYHKPNIAADYLIHHPCPRTSNGGYYCNKRTPEMTAVYEAIGELPWDASIFTCSPDRIPKIERILTTCGLDSKTATIEQISELDPILECVTCSDVQLGRATMRWNVAMEHSIRQHNGDPPTMALLDGEDAELARSRIKEEEERHNSKQHTKSCICTHCREKGPLMGLMQHVKRVHLIGNPKIGEDVVVGPNAEPYRELYRLWPPTL